MVLQRGKTDRGGNTADIKAIMRDGSWFMTARRSFSQTVKGEIPEKGRRKWPASALNAMPFWEAPSVRPAPVTGGLGIGTGIGVGIAPNESCVIIEEIASPMKHLLQDCLNRPAVFKGSSATAESVLAHFQG